MTGSKKPTETKSSTTDAPKAKAPTRAERRAAAKAAAEASGTATKPTTENVASAGEAARGGINGDTAGNTGTDQGTGAQDGGTAKPEKAPIIPEGNATQQSHEAATTAERTIDGAGLSGDALNPPVTGPIVKDNANPPVHNPLEGGNAGETTILSTSESRQDESGAIQNATAEGIGHGGGAPDGILSTGTIDTSEANPPAAIPPENLAQEETAAEPDPTGDSLFPGGHKKQLLDMLKNGATNQEMLAATGKTSIIGTMNVMVRMAGRELEVTRKDETGEKVFKLKPLESGDEGENEKPAA